MPLNLAFDGFRIWTTNVGGASVSIVTPGTTFPWNVTIISTGFIQPVGILFDGSNIWITDDDQLEKLDSSGNIILSVDVGNLPGKPIFDGTNIWVPNHLSDTVTVVRASAGTVLATLSGNGLFRPRGAAFDGERILVTNTGGSSVSLWRASDLSPLGSFSTGASNSPFAVCSDGLNFWITITNENKLVRF